MLYEKRFYIEIVAVFDLELIQITVSIYWSKYLNLQYS